MVLRKIKLGNDGNEVSDALQNCSWQSRLDNGAGSGVWGRGISQRWSFLRAGLMTPLLDIKPRRCASRDELYIRYLPRYLP